MMRHVALLLIAVAAVGIGRVPAANADGEPEGFVIEAVLEGIDQPTAVDFLPDGRLIYADLGGGVHIVDHSTLPAVSALALTVPSVVVEENEAWSELGLSGLAVDPDYAANGYIYTWYSVDVFGTQRLSRFTVVDDMASPDSAVVLWETPERATERNCCHVGGAISFGPDGNLWFSIGDRWNWNDAQDVTSSSGAIHRIAPDGSIPADNPFNDGTGPNVDSIFTYGHRNPFRIRWDVESERLFVAEVGFNSWEEINVIRLDAPGQNYEWPQCEGPGAYNDGEGRLSDCTDSFMAGFAKRAVNVGSRPRVQILLVLGALGLTVFWRAGLLARRWVRMGLAAVGVVALMVIAAESFNLSKQLSSFEDPVFAYEHSVPSTEPAIPNAPGTASVTGGAVYGGTVFPESYQGAYFFGDFINGWLSYLTFEDPTAPTYHEFSSDLGALVDVNASPGGELYYVVHYDLTGESGDLERTGSINRIRFDNGGTSP